MYNHTKHVVSVGGGAIRGMYLRMTVNPIFRYDLANSTAQDIPWDPEWVESPDEATDYGGQADDLINWIHRFKGEEEEFTWLNKKVLTKSAQ